MPDAASNSSPQLSHGGRSPVLVLGAAGFLLAGLGVIPYFAQLQSSEVTGPLLVADHFFDVAVAIALFALCTALGRFALVRLGLTIDQPIEDLAFSTAVGAGIFSIFILVIGLLSALQVSVVALVVLLCTFVARKELTQLPRLHARCFSFLRTRTGHSSFAVLSMVVLGLAAAVLIVLAIAPPGDWDSLMYHLQVPQHFLVEGRISVPDDNFHVAYVGLVHMLYIPLLAVHSSSAPAILSVLFALLLGLSVFSLAVRYFDGATASLSFVLLWASTGFLLVAITPRLDVTLALYLFLAHYALLLALRDPSHRTHFYLAAALLGLSLGIKYHALAYALALSPLILWNARSLAQSRRDMLRLVSLFALISFAAALPWLAKNAILLQAPLYPFFTERMLEPWLASLYGSAKIPDVIDPAVFGALSTVRLPFNLVYLFLAPGALTVEPEGAYWHTNVLLLLLPLWVLFIKERELNWLVIPALGYLILILLVQPATNLRYLMPAIAPLTIATSYIASRSAHRLLSTELARALVISLTVFALIPSAQVMQHWLRKSDVLGYLTGMTAEQEYLEGGFTFYNRMTSAVNRWVPADGKIVMLFEARGFYFEPTVIQDNVLTNWALLAPYALADRTCLRTTGITHVLVSHLSLRYYVLRGADLRLVGWHHFPHFADRCLVPFYQGRGFTVYRLRSEGEQGSTSLE